MNTELKKWARHQKPRLTSLEAKHALIRLALEYFRRVRPDQDPQFVQVGREWLTDAKGRKRLVIPDGSWRYEDQPLMVPVKDDLAQEPDELNSGEYVEWFCCEIQHIIRDMILPTPARERRAPARKFVDIVYPVCERGRVIRGRCDQCRIGVSGVLGDQQITARLSPLSRTSKKRRGDRREQIDEQAGMPAEERIDDAEHLDDDEVKGDAADRWLKAQDVSADVGLDESLEPADERVTDTSRELRALARRARQTGLTFHGLQGEILTLAEQRPNLTNRDIALRVSSSEGSVKDARRKIRHKLAHL